MDMDYSGISRMMERINTSGKGQYFYLCDGEGNIIYHPHQARIDNGMNTESSVKAASSKEKFTMNIWEKPQKSYGGCNQLYRMAPGLCYAV